MFQHIVEYYCRTIKLEPVISRDPDQAEAGASQRVYEAVLKDLEEHRLVPGQRLVETELSAALGVGRNAVREALKQLSMRGVVVLSPNRSPAICKFDLAETMEVLDVAGVMTGLVARIAAEKFDAARHRDQLDRAIAIILDDQAAREPGGFSRARRGFYRILLLIGGNRELQRLFPAIGMHIIYSQYQSPRLGDIRRVDYQSIYEAVRAGDFDAAEKAGRGHAERIREVILEIEGARADRAAASLVGEISGRF